MRPARAMPCIIANFVLAEIDEIEDRKRAQLTSSKIVVVSE